MQLSLTCRLNFFLATRDGPYMSPQLLGNETSNTTYPSSVLSFYNQERWHNHLGNNSPIDYEKSFWRVAQASTEIWVAQHLYTKDIGGV